MPLFIPITKVDVAKRLVYGTLSEEIPDKAGEILDYESSKPAFMEWSQQFQEASGGKSLGNVRAMHGNIAAGKLTDIQFDDENKRIEGVAKVVDDDAWNKVLEGVYTGFSIGGGYTRRWPDPQNPALMRYTPTLSEVSLVDNPAVPTATFSVIKNDGSRELRYFSSAFEKDDSTNMIGPNAVEVDDENENCEEQLRTGLAWLETQVSDDSLQNHINVLLAYLDDDESSEAEAVNKSFRTSQELLSETILLLNKRIAKLEEQPLPSRGVLKSVAKSQDYNVDESVQVNLHELSASQRAHEMIKIALAHPNKF